MLFAIIPYVRTVVRIMDRGYVCKGEFDNSDREPVVLFGINLRGVSSITYKIFVIPSPLLIENLG